MRRILLLFVLLGVPILITLVFVNNELELFPGKYTKVVKIGNSTVVVETAFTEEERQKGLSGRTSLIKDRGMVFSFGQSGQSAISPFFWMKGMLIPLDIIWINDYRVVKIHKNVPPEPEKSDDKLTKYYPDGPIDNVVEVNAGFSDKYNIKVGDNVIFYR